MFASRRMVDGRPVILAGVAFTHIAPLAFNGMRCASRER
jgi:hypothetical protein